MSWLCLSVALLVLLGTLVATTPGSETSNQAKDPLPAFCLEPPYMDPCKAMMIRYFYNANSGHCEVLNCGSCHGNRNIFLTAEESMKTRGGHAGTRG
ncbi:spleen trypsin inhibitor I-like [Hippopotamus amphibius kiboko]|uniref:spleen trypsin inhibitor I-like n=1 Tax=Hippopotamus amphibius kiboko TaxID=575201 RepID=UPI00259AD72E|nr:spleen trypsin inhibitor I-like [Hippopotamus amphibius kiboko]